MMKTAFVLLCGLLLAAGPAAAETQGNNQQTQGNQGKHGNDQSMSSTGSATQHPAIAGVVTKVDANGHQLTLVTPAGAEVDVTRIGKSVLVERDVNLVSVQAPVQSSAKVFIDGKQSSLSNLKEGDVVRAAFDPNQQAFVNVAAVTPKEVDSNLDRAHSDLHPASSGSQNNQSK